MLACRHNLCLLRSEPLLSFILVVLQPDEYDQLGSYALIGLPEQEYQTK
jgi:hypothetical protein